MGQLICTACGKQLYTEDTICSRCGCHYFHRPQAEDLGTYYQRAFSMRLEGRFADAIRIYQDILAVSHDQVEAHRGITYARYGIVWKNSGREMEYEVDFEKELADNMVTVNETAAGDVSDNVSDDVSAGAVSDDVSAGDVSDNVSASDVSDDVSAADVSDDVSAGDVPDDISAGDVSVEYLTEEERPVVPANRHAPVEIIRDQWIASDEISSQEISREEISPSEVFPSEVFPSEVFPSEVFPSEVFPSEVFPSEVFPSEVFPSEMSPADFPPEEETVIPAPPSHPTQPYYIPTLQIMREEPFLEDPDYLLARDSLNLTQQAAIEEDAQPIHLLQQQILEMADARPAYDIFLCCNAETAEEETGRKAKEIYLFLREEGYRVFQMGLEPTRDELETTVTYALWTAPVMIVIGSEAMDFRTPEVSELWHRFQYMSPLSSKLIIPVFPGLAASDLPSEFSMMPCMDYSVIGFSNRLLRTIDKQFRKPEPNLQEDNRTVARLKKSGQTFLELGNYRQAFAIYEELYTRFPDHYEGWWGMIVSKTQGFTNTHLDQKELNDWYRCARLLSKESPEFAEKEPQFIAYKKRVYGNVIQKDRQNVLDMVDQVNGQIRGIHQASEELEATLSRSRKQYNESNKEMNYRLRQNQAEQEELYARSAACRRFIILGILISIGGIILVHDAESTMTSALVFLGFIIIIMSLVNLKFGHVSENLERLEEEEEELTRKRAHYKKKYEEYKEAQAQTLEGNQYEERRMQAFVVQAAQWLDIDDDAMFGNILAEEMQGTGLIFHTNSELITQRKELDNQFHQLFR